MHRCLRPYCPTDLAKIVASHFNFPIINHKWFKVFVYIFFQCSIVAFNCFFLIISENYVILSLFLLETNFSIESSFLFFILEMYCPDFFPLFFYIIVQVLLSPFSPTTPPHPSHPHLPPLILPPLWLFPCVLFPCVLIATQ